MILILQIKIKWRRIYLFLKLFLILCTTFCSLIHLRVAYFDFKISILLFGSTRIIINCIIHFRKPSESPDEYSKILFNLLSFKSSDVVLHTYLALNKTLKKLLNNFNSESKKIDRLLENLLCTNVLNEIICFGCINSNEQVYMCVYI